MFFKRSKGRTVTFWMNVRIPTSFLAKGYEEPVEAYLNQNDLGTITGHNALLSEDGTEVLKADFSVTFKSDDEAALKEVIQILEEAGAPIGCRWSYDTTPNKKMKFGSLDALLLKVEGLTPEGHASFEHILSQIVEEFHEQQRDKAGYQGLLLTDKKATASFHGFAYDEMASSLDTILQRRTFPYAWSFERTSPRFGDLSPQEA